MQPLGDAPLLLVLHGYGSGGNFNDVYMKMTSIADAKGFFYDLYMSQFRRDLDFTPEVDVQPTPVPAE